MNASLLKAFEMPNNGNISENSSRPLLDWLAYRLRPAGLK